MKHFKEEIIRAKSEAKKQKEIIIIEQKKALEELRKAREEQHKELAKVREEQQKIMEERHKELEENGAIVRAHLKNKNVLFLKNNGKNNIHFISKDGKEEEVEVKKVIRIKMPKGTKLKLNVRHGEVKIAQNVNNLKATLSHSRLLAQKIDGAQTNIEASYAYVNVKHWNQGQLKVNFIKDVTLGEVEDLSLSAASSNVTINHLKQNALINGSFGKLEIIKVSPKFSNLDIFLENTDALLSLPKTAYDLTFNGMSSKLDYPQKLTVKSSSNFNNTLIKGYHLHKNSDKSVNITAKYSNVQVK
jgi:hypothetical protein